ncbi:DegT/DnrJ/EryC1/StrS aminotransferase [Pseudoalteromonas sp. BSi20652]|uniref:UDP-4-amino-4, 6-dideoxy-N-acetyl-beta-L-altrosamine transaminase n=1 Tax=Pseudoalteromonas sp. BSi20652 TaxID=388384 RepID=UPI0002319676|nr:UDP-4-amino-4,6-dideoxy-N-acetyl-beta-L-altrosamine transaminase [Pseudoalteromonas sp. BSi20652]GAA60049.1 DegT/DnrJ/EryC1/StrS aminotransferase [Pseudoalteromonas sp. BSi20652]
MIPYGKQLISQADIDSVVAVLQSDWLTQGPKTPAFEAAIANYCNAQYGIAVNSATSALHIACLALNVSEGDTVWTSPISFVASANCALYCGAAVDFVDIDLATGNMSVSVLADKLVSAKQNNCLPKVVIPVHLAGQSCDMEAIYDLSKQYGFKIIEDASHAIGAQYNGNKVGCCEFSDITVFSFHPVKIITSAEGGMAVTNNKPLAKKLQRLRSHGITNDPNEMTEPSHGPWYYQQVELGFNYRMTELQAALGLSQLDKLDEFVTTRNALAISYSNAFETMPLSHLTQLTKCYSSYHLYVVKLADGHSHLHRHIIEQLRSKGIISHLHYIPIHTQPFYKKMGFKDCDFPNAMKYYKTAFTIPLHPQLTEQEQSYIIDEIGKLL